MPNPAARSPPKAKRAPPPQPAKPPFSPGPSSCLWSRRRFRRLHNFWLFAQICPANPVEHALFEAILIANWRKLRYCGVETTAIHTEIKRRATQNPQLAAENDITQATAALEAFTGSSKFLDRLNTLETRCDRQFDRALKGLLAFRAAKGTEK